jgi:hypothetical protein
VSATADFRAVVLLDGLSVGLVAMLLVYTKLMYMATTAGSLSGNFIKRSLRAAQLPFIGRRMKAEQSSSHTTPSWTKSWVDFGS